MKKSDITKVLIESKKVLKSKGKIIIGVSHPLFDCYMRKGLFDVDYVETNFSGYFNSGESFLIHKQCDKGVMTFEDYHWLLSDYVDCINKVGLRILKIDECEPIEGTKEFLEEKKRFPTYMVIVCDF